MTPARLQTAERLADVAGRLANLNSFVGLDGFVDEIFHVVDKRQDQNSYTRLPTITRYAERMTKAAGKSTNIELVSQRVKLGGNGPILANALAKLGLHVTYLGNLGFPNIHPVFEQFRRAADVHSIAEPGYTDALEFEDGKVMVGKHQALKEVSWENIVARYGKDKLQTALDRARLVCFVNWTMLTATSSIWDAIQREILPGIDGERRLLFIDLADPEKRTRKDLRHALELVGRFQEHFDVLLGLNQKESAEVGRVLDLDVSDDSPERLAQRAAAVRSELAINTVVIHPVKFAVAADAHGTAQAAGPFTAAPVITTGAGDHFNAGFCLGRALALPNELSLWIGVATSGFYVRNASSPSVSDLLNFLRHWPAEDATPAR